ncbi:putative sulfate exporter family transporter [Leptospira sp. FAT2]|uniref:YeiH family protein n=1 Tax=Leptospira sanjuanensis TaxID=2879643 RepID=UPI001EE7A5B8|nr:putative sulfate exporter family transporter [Leptospira sanjuanensis]MCG6192348.1 putative sulfate exporter family transporter [Leptospira sanjuanensis]
MIDSYLKKARDTFPGLALIAFLGLISESITSTLNLGFSSMLIGLSIGVLIGNYVGISKKFKAGVDFSVTSLMRMSVVLIGFRISIEELISLGFATFLLDVLVVFFSLGFSYWISIKYFKFDKDFSCLLAIGSSICGASAIVAASPLLKTESFKSSTAISVVTVCGTISMILTLVFANYDIFGALNHDDIGVLLGASIQETGQVVTAGYSISVNAGDKAVITKLARILLLAPVLILLNYYFLKDGNSTNQGYKSIKIPGFVILFLLVVLSSATEIVSHDARTKLSGLGTFLLLCGMIGVGFNSNLIRIVRLGFKPIYAGLLISGFMISVSIALIFLFKTI